MVQNRQRPLPKTCFQMNLRMFALADYPEVLVLELEFPYAPCFNGNRPFGEVRCLIPYPHRVGQDKCCISRAKSWTSVNRTKKVIGQLESVLRGFNEHSPCADVLQRLATARGGMNNLMAELMEDHTRNHRPATSKSLEDAADDLIEIVRTYLK
jgi:DNA-binding FrmR family transcriptional regulator